jgi:phosphatidylinositol alpha-1,6-mannosyltransferase
MRLLMLNNEFPPLGGGMGTVNLALIRWFSQVPDLEIDLITSGLGKRHESERFAERIWIHRVPVNNRNLHHSTNRELLTYSGRALSLALRLARSRRYNLGLAWSAVPAGAVAFAMRRIIGLPYLVRVCGPDIPGFERRYKRLYPLLTPVIRQIWRGSEAVIAKCQEEADMIWSVDPKAKVIIVPNGVDVISFPPREMRPDGDELNILCVARLIQRKGQPQLLKAVKRLVGEGFNIKLDLVGTGDAENEYRSLVDQLDIVGRVHFTGYVPRDKIIDHYAGADVFVLPSYNEGMSMASLEAMAAGLPLIVTRTGGATELVEEGVNGFTYKPGDESALVDHMRTFAVDRSLARKFGAASREKAARFSWDGVTQNYLELLASLTKSGAIA